jgi:hypothetical protein
MTLLAAYKIDDIPILVGDAVTTALSYKGLRRKIYLISPNLVLGWTGYLRVAREIIPDIFRTFYNTQVEKEEFERFLTSYDTEQFGMLDVRLTGWLYNDVHNCFLWQSGYPSEVFYNDSYFEGTGEKYFEDVLRPDHAKVAGGSNPQTPNNKEYFALYETLAHTGEAFFSELLFPEQWNQTFGFAYEIFGFIDGRFRAVHTVTHLGWDYYWEPISKTGTPRLATFAAKYIHRGDCSIIQQVNHKDLALTTYTNYIVMPVYDWHPSEEIVKAEFSFLSDFYVHYILLRPYTQYPIRLCFVTGSGEPRQPIWIEKQGNRIFAGMESEYVDEIFRKGGA